MPFTFRVVFTGVCTFVPSSDGKKLAVLLPDAREKATALDDDPLERHQGFLELDPSRAWSGVTSGHRFRALWEIPEPGDLRFELTGGSSDTSFAKPTDVVGLEELFTADTKEFAQVNPALLTHPSPPGLLSRTIFDRGQLWSRIAPSTWWLRDSLGRGITNRRLAHELVVEIAGVESAAVHFKPFGGSESEVVRFATGTTPVELFVAHLCETNPLRWDSEPVPIDSPDLDFKWCFELLERRDEIKEMVDAAWLPCPVRVPRRQNAATLREYDDAWRAAKAQAASAGRSIGGDNCFGTYAGSAEF